MEISVKPELLVETLLAFIEKQKNEISDLHAKLKLNTASETNDGCELPPPLHVKAPWTQPIDEEKRLALAEKNHTRMIERRHLYWSVIKKIEEISGLNFKEYCQRHFPGTSWAGLSRDIYRFSGGYHPHRGQSLEIIKALEAETGIKICG